MSEFEHVVVGVQDRILTIRLNRPDKKNALTFTMYNAGRNSEASIVTTESSPLTVAPPVALQV